MALTGSRLRISPIQESASFKRADIGVGKYREQGANGRGTVSQHTFEALRLHRSSRTSSTKTDLSFWLIPLQAAALSIAPDLGLRMNNQRRCSQYFGPIAQYR